MWIDHIQGSGIGTWGKDHSEHMAPVFQEPMAQWMGEAAAYD